jgi:acyl-coenzyme A synthetase/AMP-(fatty) acid ligase
VNIYVKLTFRFRDADGDGRYWNDEEQTRSVMKMDEQGTLWMHTGDEGIMDEDGYLQGEFSN